MPRVNEDDLLYSVLIRNFIRSVESDGEPPRKVAVRVGSKGEKNPIKTNGTVKRGGGPVSKPRDEEEAADSVSSDD